MSDLESTSLIDEDEAVTTSRHRIDFGERTLEYRADAGTVVVRADDDRPLVSMFFIAYTGDAVPAAPRRPLTFLFNGGPGSASLWLNIGGFGPKRAPTGTPAATLPPPYRVGDNPHSLLEFSDLVFLDAPGTGYSRLFPGVSPAEVWGVDQDVDVFARAITRYLTLTNNWNSPRFLFGESYGTTRAAALVHTLQNRGIDFNGVVLLSTMLNWAGSNLGLDQGYINVLPSYAATARYHGRSANATADMEGLLEEARDFAQGEYAAVLQRGDLVERDRERSVAEQLSALIGVDVAYLLQRKLRIDMEEFREILLADEGRVIGRFDTRFVADNQYVIGNGSHDPATNDAATAGVNSAHLSTFREHVAGDIGFCSDLHYRHLHNIEISRAWDWHHKAPGVDIPMPVPNVSLDLAAAMRRNPNLKVQVMGGVYDLATPFFGAEYDIAHLHLGTDIRANVRTTFYESGHMTFVDEEAAAHMKQDLGEFYADANHD